MDGPPSRHGGGAAMMGLVLAFAVAVAAPPVGQTVEGGVVTLRFSDGSSPEVLENARWPNEESELVVPERFELRTDRVGDVMLDSRHERLAKIDPRYFGLSLAYTDCLRHLGSWPGELEGCAADEAVRQRERLDRVIDALKQLSRDEGIDPLMAEAIAPAKLDRVQQAWVVFREQDCAMRTLRNGSTWAPATAAQCEAEATALRAQTLEDFRLSLSR